MNWVRRKIPSRDAQHGAVMAAATLLAGGFDYLVLVVAVGMLGPAQSIIFLAVMGLLQVFVHVTNVIRNVVAFYTAEVSGEGAGAVAGFFRQSWRWAWRRGAVAMLLFALSAPLLSGVLQIDSIPALLVASTAVFMLFVRPVTDGALQGLQQFTQLGAVQVAQALLRLLFTGLFILVGWRAPGAVLGLPLAAGCGLILALIWLRPYRNGAETRPTVQISRQYSLVTLVGLLAFALLVNADAILVNRLFSAEVAGGYSPVITLGKMNLFVPLGLGLVLFPKTRQRLLQGRDPRPVLLLALAATFLPGLLLTALYVWQPGVIIDLIFNRLTGAAYGDPGLLLGVIGLATTLFAGLNIWLQYALSLDRRFYVYLLAGLVAVDILLILFSAESLLQMGWIMVGAGLAGNLGGLLLLRTQPSAAIS